MKKPVQKVVFRKFKDGEVLALLCNTAAGCQHGNVQSYMHVGQHAEASRTIGRDLKLATQEEFTPLLRELRSIYFEYDVIPVKRLIA